MERSRAVEVGSTVRGGGGDWEEGQGVSRLVGPRMRAEAQGGRSGMCHPSGSACMGVGVAVRVGRGQREGLELWASRLLMLQMDPRWGAGEESGDRRQREQEISPVALNPRSGSAQKTALLSCDNILRASVPAAKMSKSKIQMGRTIVSLEP